MDENILENINKSSYYCQSCYTSIYLFKDLVENRKIDFLDELMVKIIDSLSNLITFYTRIKSEQGLITILNQKLNLILDGYTNYDYCYLKDVFEYEIIPVIESLFNYIKQLIVDLQ